MKHRTLFAALLFLVFAAPALAEEQTKTQVVTFDHLQGSVTEPAVLELRDGEVFTVKFINTLPSRFDYEISPVETAKEKDAQFNSDGTGVKVDLPLTETMLTWRHRKEFALYQVHVTLRAGETNPKIGEDTSEVEASTVEESIDGEVFLYSYTFPIWVKTIDWDLRFTSGIAFSELRDDRFFIETDDQGTDATDDDEKLVRRNRVDIGDSRPDIVAFVNLLTPDAGPWKEDWKVGGRLGLAFGFGIGESSEPRYFFGPSWTFGHNEYFVAMAGWTGGNVRRLPAAQAIDRAPISDNVLNELDSSFEHGFFAGLTFSFNRGDDKTFITGLNGKSGRTDTKKEE